MSDDLSHGEYEAKERGEKRDEEFKEEFFRHTYPAMIAGVRRIVSQATGDLLVMREDIFDDMIEIMIDDLREFQFKDALALAGVKPFDPWAVPPKSSQAEEAIAVLKIANEAYVAGMKVGRE